MSQLAWDLGLHQNWIQLSSCFHRLQLSRGRFARFQGKWQFHIEHLGAKSRKAKAKKESKRNLRRMSFRGKDLRRYTDFGYERAMSQRHVSFLYDSGLTLLFFILPYSSHISPRHRDARVATLARPGQTLVFSG